MTPGALYLFGSGGHVDYILNAVVKEVPGVLEICGGILNHNQLCGVKDACQRCSFCVPVHLQTERGDGQLGKCLKQAKPFHLR